MCVRVGTRVCLRDTEKALQADRHTYRQTDRDKRTHRGRPREVKNKLPLQQGQKKKTKKQTTTKSVLKRV